MNKKYNIRDFIKNSKKTKVLSPPIDLKIIEILNTYPSQFVANEFNLLSEGFINNDNIYDETNTSIFQHYFMTMNGFLKQNDLSNFEILKKHSLQLITKFKSKIFASKEPILYYLPRLKQNEIILEILSHFADDENFKEFAFGNLETNELLLPKFYEKIDDIEIIQKIFNLLIMSYNDKINHLINQLAKIRLKNKLKEIDDLITNKKFREFFEIIKNLDEESLKQVMIYPLVGYSLISNLIQSNDEDLIKNLFIKLNELNDKKFIENLFFSNPNASDSPYNSFLELLKLESFEIFELVFIGIFKLIEADAGKFVLDNQKNNIFHYISKLTGQKQTLVFEFVYNFIEANFGQNEIIKLLNNPNKFNYLPVHEFIKNHKNGNNLLILQTIILNSKNLDKLDNTDNFTLNEAQYLMSVDKYFDERRSGNTHIRPHRSYHIYPCEILTLIDDPDDFDSMLNFLLDNSLFNPFTLSKCGYTKEPKTLLYKIIQKKLKPSSVVSLTNYFVENLSNLSEFALKIYGLKFPYFNIFDVLNFFNIFNSDKIDEYSNLLLSFISRGFDDIIKLRTNKDELKFFNLNKFYVNSNSLGHPDEVLIKNQIESLINNYEELKSQAMAMAVKFVNTPSTSTLFINANRHIGSCNYKSFNILNTCINSKGSLNPFLVLLNKIENFETFIKFLECIFEFTNKNQTFNIITSLFQYLNKTQQNFLLQILTDSEDDFLSKYVIKKFCLDAQKDSPSNIYLFASELQNFIYNRSNTTDLVTWSLCFIVFNNIYMKLPFEVKYFVRLNFYYISKYDYRIFELEQHTSLHLTNLLLKSVGFLFKPVENIFAEKDKFYRFKYILITLFILRETSEMGSSSKEHIKEYLQIYSKICNNLIVHKNLHGSPPRNTSDSPEKISLNDINIILLDKFLYSPYHFNSEVTNGIDPMEEPSQGKLGISNYFSNYDKFYILLSLEKNVAQNYDLNVANFFYYSFKNFLIEEEIGFASAYFKVFDDTPKFIEKNKFIEYNLITMTNYTNNIMPIRNKFKSSKSNKLKPEEVISYEDELVLLKNNIILFFPKKSLAAESELCVQGAVQESSITDNNEDIIKKNLESLKIILFHSYKRKNSCMSIFEFLVNIIKNNKIFLSLFQTYNKYDNSYALIRKLHELFLNSDFKQDLNKFISFNYLTNFYLDNKHYPLIFSDDSSNYLMSYNPFSFLIDNDNPYKNNKSVIKFLHSAYDKFKSSNYDHQLFSKYTQSEDKKLIDQIFSTNIKVFTKNFKVFLVDFKNYQLENNFGLNDLFKSKTFAESLSFIIYHVLQKFNKRFVKKQELENLISSYIQFPQLFDYVNCYNKKLLLITVKLFVSYFNFNSKFDESESIALSIKSSLLEFKDIKFYENIENLISNVTFISNELLNCVNINFFKTYVNEILKNDNLFIHIVMGKRYLQNLFLAFFIYEDDLPLLEILIDKLKLNNDEDFIKLFLNVYNIGDELGYILYIKNNNNNFTKFLSKYNHSTLYYFAIINNSKNVLGYFRNKFSFRNVEKRFNEHKRETDQYYVKYNLQKSLLVSKNLDLFLSFNDAIKFYKDDDYDIICSSYNLSNKGRGSKDDDYNIIKALSKIFNEEFQVSKLFKRCILTGNFNLAKLIFDDFPNKKILIKSEFCFSGDDCNGLEDNYQYTLLNLLAQKNEYYILEKVCEIIKENKDDEDLQNLLVGEGGAGSFEIDQLYHGNNPTIPLISAVKSKSFKSFSILYTCTPNRFISISLKLNNNFISELLNLFNSKCSDLSKFIKETSPELYININIVNEISKFQQKYFESYIGKPNAKDKEFFYQLKYFILISSQTLSNEYIDEFSKIKNKYIIVKCLNFLFSVLKVYPDHLLDLFDSTSENNNEDFKLSLLYVMAKNKMDLLDDLDYKNYFKGINFDDTMNKDINNGWSESNALPTINLEEIKNLPEFSANLLKREFSNQKHLEMKQKFNSNSVKIFVNSCKNRQLKVANLFYQNFNLSNKIEEIILEIKVYNSSQYFDIDSICGIIFSDNNLLSSYLNKNLDLEFEVNINDINSIYFNFNEEMSHLKLKNLGNESLNSFFKYYLEFNEWSEEGSILTLSDKDQNNIKKVLSRNMNYKFLTFSQYIFDNDKFINLTEKLIKNLNTISEENPQKIKDTNLIFESLFKQYQIYLNNMIEKPEFLKLIETSKISVEVFRQKFNFKRLIEILFNFYNDLFNRIAQLKSYKFTVNLNYLNSFYDDYIEALAQNEDYKNLINSDSTDLQKLIKEINFYNTMLIKFFNEINNFYENNLQSFSAIFNKDDFIEIDYKYECLIKYIIEFINVDYICLDYSEDSVKLALNYLEINAQCLNDIIIKIFYDWKYVEYTANFKKEKVKLIFAYYFNKNEFQYLEISTQSLFQKFIQNFYFNLFFFLKQSNSGSNCLVSIYPEIFGYKFDNHSSNKNIRLDYIIENAPNNEHKKYLEKLKTNLQITLKTLNSNTDIRKFYYSILIDLYENKTIDENANDLNELFLYLLGNIPSDMSISPYFLLKHLNKRLKFNPEIGSSVINFLKDPQNFEIKTFKEILLNNLYKVNISKDFKFNDLNIYADENFGLNHKKFVEFFKIIQGKIEYVINLKFFYTVSYDKLDLILKNFCEINSNKKILYNLNIPKFSVKSLDYYRRYFNKECLQYEINLNTNIEEFYYESSEVFNAFKKQLNNPEMPIAMHEFLYDPINFKFKNLKEFSSIYEKLGDFKESNEHLIKKLYNIPPFNIHNYIEELILIFKRLRNFINLKIEEEKEFFSPIPKKLLTLKEYIMVLTKFLDKDKTNQFVCSSESIFDNLFKTMKSNCMPKNILGSLLTFYKNLIIDELEISKPSYDKNSVDIIIDFEAVDFSHHKDEDKTFAIHNNPNFNLFNHLFDISDVEFLFKKNEKKIEVTIKLLIYGKNFENLFKNLDNQIENDFLYFAICDKLPFDFYGLKSENRKICNEYIFKERCNLRQKLREFLLENKD